MPVSGELRYFGPAFSSVERVHPVKAITLPASLAMGNMTRLRNLEYMAERASGFGRRSSRESASPPCPSKERTDKGGATPDARCLDSARDDTVGGRDDGSSCFQEKRPLSRRTSSLNSFLRRSRRRKPESGEYPMRKRAIISSSRPRPARYWRAWAPSGRRRHS